MSNTPALNFLGFPPTVFETCQYVLVDMSLRERPTGSAAAIRQEIQTASVLAERRDMSSTGPLSPSSDSKQLASPYVDDGSALLKEANFFRPGRYFRIYSAREPSLHGEAFVLLDQKYSHDSGSALQVQQYEENEALLNRNSFHRSHVALLGESSTPSKQGDRNRRSVYLEDEDEDEAGSDRHSYINLDRMHHIPFNRYRVVDLGILTPASLAELRRHYVTWLHYSWNIGYNLSDWTASLVSDRARWDTTSMGDTTPSMRK
jgi:hypothetical protein